MVVEKRKKLRDCLRNEFPDADNIVVRSEYKKEKAIVSLSDDGRKEATDKIEKIKRGALIVPRVIMLDNKDDSGFNLEGLSPDHLLAIFQE